VYEGPESNFPHLAADVFPGTEPEDWGYDEYVAGL
jgi:hypothetical protein